VWKLGQEKMLEVYRDAKLSELRLPPDSADVVNLGTAPR
jgi:hypothetical protein